MLALQDHFRGCASCDSERQSLRQLKSLLRGLHEPRLRRDFPQRIALRLEESQGSTGGWHVLCLPAPRPQRGRRLVTALALSCLTVLSFVTSFAPDGRPGVYSTSSLISPLTSPSPALTSPVGSGTTFASDFSSLTPAVNAPRPDYLILTDFSDARRDRFFALTDTAQPALGMAGRPAAGPSQMQFTALRIR